MKLQNLWFQYGIYINAVFAFIVFWLSLANFYGVLHYNPYSNTLLTKSFVTHAVSLDKDLFGVYVPQLNRDKVGESSLDYKVTGILFSKDKPYAMLSADDGEEKLVTVGDKLNSLKIYAIKDDYVVILNNNQLERLNLEKPKL